MKYFFSSLFFFISSHLLYGQHVTDSINISNIYSQLNKYIQEEKYDSCIQYFDTESVRYFQEISRAIYFGDKNKYLQMDAIDIFFSLMIKAKMIEFGYKDSSLNNALIISLKAGRQELQPEKGLINFQASGQWVSANMTLGGKETDKSIVFVKEESGWKINITSELLNSRLKNETILKRFDGSKEKLLAYIVETLGIPEDRILKPLFLK